MVKDRDNHEFKSALGTSTLPADRYGLRPPALAPEDDPALREERVMRSLFNNASRIPHGHAQLIAAIASGRPDARTPALTEKERQRENTERYYTQQMQRFAEWNAQVVTIGGVQMTNEDAQRARRRFIANEDEHAERAVQRGLIRDGEQGSLKHAMRRRCDLEERVARGNASNGERRELDDLKNSRIGRAVDEATANIHTGKDIELDAQNASIKKLPGANVNELPNSRDIFQTAPVAQKAFAQAMQPPLDNLEPKAPTPSPPVGPSHLANRTGLDF